MPIIYQLKNYILTSGFANMPFKSTSMDLKPIVILNSILSYKINTTL